MLLGLPTVVVSWGVKHFPFARCLPGLNGLSGDMEELRNEREENDFLAVAASLGMMDDSDVEKGREKERKRPKPEYDPSNSKFGSWFGGLVVGTPMSNDRESAADEDDVLVRLSQRVEERRVELGLEPEDKESELSSILGDGRGENDTEPDVQSSNDDALKRVRRRRKVK